MDMEEAAGINCSFTIITMFKPSFPRRRESNLSENGCPTMNLGYDELNKKTVTIMG
jgi:hypothetical protein